MGNQIYSRRQFGSPALLRSQRREQEQRATPENPSFSLNDPAAWAAFEGGEPSASGVSVTHDSVMKAASFWQGASMISGDAAKLHLSVYKDEDCTEIDKTHPAHNLVRWDWNDETTAFQGWRTLLLHALIWPGGFAFIDRNGRGEPIGLYNLLPDRTSVQRQAGWKVIVTETTRPDGSPWLRPIPDADVLHLKGMSADGINGMDLTFYARNLVGTILATEQFQARYFRNGIRTGGILMLPREMPDKAKAKVEEGFASKYSGPDNWFKTIVLRDGAKFEAAQATLRDSQMTELDEQLVRKACRFLNLAPSRLGLSDSVSYNSKAEDNQGYLDTTLSPWLLGIVGECRKKLLSKKNTASASHYFGHDTDGLLRMNELARYQVYAIAKQAKLLTTNECRRREGYPPIEGGDELDSPTTPAGGIDKGGATPPRGDADPTGGLVDTKPKADEPTPPQRNYANNEVAARRRIVFGIASQARHKSGRPKAFLEWIDGGLVSHRAHCREVFGNESLVDEFLAALKAVAETANAEQLAAKVDEVVTQKEIEA